MGNCTASFCLEEKDHLFLSVFKSGSFVEMLEAKKIRKIYVNVYKIVLEADWVKCVVNEK